MTRTPYRVRRHHGAGPPVYAIVDRSGDVVRDGYVDRALARQVADLLNRAAVFEEPDDHPHATRERES